MKRNMRYTALLFLIPIAFGLTSCKAKNKPQEITQTNLKGNINILCDAEDINPIKFIISSFRSKNPNVTINVKSYKDTAGLDSDMKSYQCDVAVVKEQNTVNFIQKYSDKLQSPGSMMSVVKDNYPKERTYNISLKDKIYGIPWYSMPWAMYYRSDVFQNEGISIQDIKTWDDFIQAGLKVRKDTGEKLLCIPAGSRMQLFQVLENELQDSLEDDDGKVSLAGDKTVRIVNLMRSLYDSGVVAEVGTYQDMLAKLKKSEAVCLLYPSNGVDLLMNSLPEEKEKWSVIDLPAFEPGGNHTISFGGSNFLEMSGTKNQEAVEAFISYSVQDEKISSSLLEKYGLFPAYDNMHYLDIFTKPVGYFSYEEVWDKFKSIEELSEGYEYKNDFPTIQRIIDPKIKGMISSKDDIKPLLKKAQSDIEKSLSSPK